MRCEMTLRTEDLRKEKDPSFTKTQPGWNAKQPQVSCKSSCFNLVRETWSQTALTGWQQQPALASVTKSLWSALNLGQ